MASPTRINLEEPVRVASLTRINLEEPISSGYPAQPGLTWRNPAGLPSTTRINLTLCQSSVFCTLIHMWRCRINCSYYSYVKKIEKLLIRICEFELSKSNTGRRFFFNQFLFCRRNHREKSLKNLLRNCYKTH